MHFAHAGPATRGPGEIIADEIKRMDDVLQRSEAAFSDILDGFRRSIRCSEVRLGALYNATNPLLGLPDEVLALIMKEAQSICAATGRTRRVEVDSSHVCRRLRHAALSTSTLWTRISAVDLGAPNRLEAYLTRSNGRLLDVDLTISESFKGSSASFWPIMMKIVSHAALWRSFRFSYHHPHSLRWLCPVGGWYHPVPFLKDILQVPSLQLLDLYLNCPDIPYSISPAKDPHPIFQQWAPNLSTVVLKTWKFNQLWLLPTHCNLTSLTIGSTVIQQSQDYDHSQQAPIPIVQLLSLPTLRQFALIDGTSNSLYPPRWDMTLPLHSSTAAPQYCRLRSLRIPVHLLPYLFLLPRQVFEEMMHLFVDVLEIHEHFFPTLQEALNTYVCDIFPKLEYLTLCCDPDEEATFSREESHLLMRMTSGISHLAIICHGHEMVDGLLDRNLDNSLRWPDLVDVFIGHVNTEPEDEEIHDLIQWCVWRRQLRSAFSLKITEWYIDHVFSQDSFRYAEELVIKPGILREVDGPDLPDVDKIWIS